MGGMQPQATRLWILQQKKKGGGEDENEEDEQQQQGRAYITNYTLPTLEAPTREMIFPRLRLLLIKLSLSNSLKLRGDPPLGHARGTPRGHSSGGHPGGRFGYLLGGILWGHFWASFKDGLAAAGQAFGRPTDDFGYPNQF